jgi:GNAT superfamily N-acetyltransferase
MALIRRARASDIAEVAALYHVVWHETQAPFMPSAEITHRSLEFFVHRMTMVLHATLVTELNGRIAAFSAWRGHLLGQLFVAMPHRGTGVASNLLKTSEIEMAKEGTNEAELHCVVGNERARCFYERMGWVHRGKIMEWVGGEHEQIGVPFWRMMKVIWIQRQKSGRPKDY